MKDFSQTKIRCSALGQIMTDPRSGKELSETCKTYLLDLYIKEKYGREKEISSKYTIKGTMVEEDSITLYSLHRNILFEKNEEIFENSHILGTPDIVLKDEIIDIKSSWDIFTFFKVQTKPIDKDYYWQLQGYMAMSGAKKARLVYCLVNTPVIFLNDEKNKLFYKLDAVTKENKEYKQACEELELSMTFDDIPIETRIYEISIERNDEDINRINQRVEECRKWLQEFESKNDKRIFQGSSNLLQTI